MFHCSNKAVQVHDGCFDVLHMYLTPDGFADRQRGTAGNRDCIGQRDGHSDHSHEDRVPEGNRRGNSPVVLSEMTTVETCEDFDEGFRKRDLLRSEGVYAACSGKPGAVDLLVMAGQAKRAEMILRNAVNNGRPYVP